MPDVLEQVSQYHASLDQVIGDNQYDQLDVDFVHDDIEAIDGSGYAEGEYMGLPDQPDIDEHIDNTNAERQVDTYDKYIGVEVAVPDRKGQKLMAKVMKRIRSSDSNCDGNAYNPLLDHSIYQVEFSDGTTEELTANVIAENMLSGCDSQGVHYQILSEMIDHKKDGSAIRKEDGYIKSNNGSTPKPKITTRGWKLLVEWKDGSIDWVPLKDLKASNPIELAEYAIANNISEEPAFNWWVKKTLRKRDRMISKVKSKYWRTSHKFGIRIPKTVDEALRIDRETGTDYWSKAIEKEMKNVRIAFDKLEGVTPEDMRVGKVRPGYAYCGTHRDIRY